MAQFPINGTWKPVFTSTFPVPDSATTTYTIKAPFPCRLLDGHFIKNGNAAGAGDTIDIGNPAGPTLALGFDISALTGDDIARATASENVSNPTGSKWAAGDDIAIVVTSAGGADVGGELVLVWEQLQS